MARGTTIIGLAKLNKKLSRLPKVAKDLIRQEMAKAADDIVRMMRSLVPVDSAALQNSIGWTWGAAPKGSLVVATLKGAGVGGDLTITIYAGSRDKTRGADDAYYVRWVEFGTSKMAAQPFFFVSWRAGRRGARRRVSNAVRKGAKLVAAGR